MHGLQSRSEATERTQDPSAGQTCGGSRKDAHSACRSRGHCKFKILVWGPDPKSSHPAAAVRTQIRDELCKLGHDAFFSEELTVRGIPTNLQELLQLQHINLVINLAASHGSVAEFENYGVILGERLLVFLNDAARGGFTTTGTRNAFRAKGGFAEFFNDEDLKTGVLVLAARDWVEFKAYAQKYALEAIERLKDSLL